MTHLRRAFVPQSPAKRDQRQEPEQHLPVPDPLDPGYLVDHIVKFAGQQFTHAARMQRSEEAGTVPQRATTYRGVSSARYRLLAEECRRVVGSW